MIKVIIESPYAGDIEKNTTYARKCIKDSLDRGEAPIASHLLYTQPGILDDTIEAERKQGIDAGLAWREVADIHAFYIDNGVSVGMKYAMNYAESKGYKIQARSLRQKGNLAHDQTENKQHCNTPENEV